MRDFKIDFYGTSTVGERGQIVIPAKVREKLEIKAGEQFIFFGHGRMIHFVKAHEIDSILNKMTQKITDNFSSLRNKIKENLK